MTQIKAIETTYKGYRFRSRLEARWAVFFDALGLPYRYEHQGYMVGKDKPYLPDFDLDECYIEIKGQAPTEEELRLAEGLAKGSGKSVYILSGDIDMATLHVDAFVPEPTPTDRMYLDLGFDFPIWAEHMKRLATKGTLSEAISIARQARFEHGERPD
jgi:hypothetical protein